MPHYRIAVVAGDGIGPEVTAEALKVLGCLEDGDRLGFAFEEVEAGAGCYQRTGEDLPRETLEVCQAADAILFGAAGLPDVRFPDGTELAPQLTLRVTLDLYLGLRPIRLYPGTPSPLRLGDGDAIDYVIVRENTEGLYASRGAGVRVGGHVVTDTLVVTRPGTARICRRAFELARRRRGAPRDGARRVTCVDKSNVLKSYAFFRQIFDEVAGDFPEVRAEHAYVDAMSMYMVQRPWHYDVVVGLFQPSHGTAPDIAGKGLANPLAAILSAGSMLGWLGERDGDQGTVDAAGRIEAAVAEVVRQGRTLTPDLGGAASTAAVGDAVAARL